MRGVVTVVLLGLLSGSAIAHSMTVADSVQFICNELLGRPTSNSITVNLCANKDLDVFVEYGTRPATYTNQTPASTFQNNTPFNIVLNNLQPGTMYYYRVRYRITKSTDFAARAEHSFTTAKLKGTAFTFAIQADPHLDSNSNPAVYALTLQNILSQRPDFLLDLGDTFMSEKISRPTQDTITFRHLLLRSYYDLICHSIPLYLVIGNHEGELGWLLDGTANNLAVLASNTRTKYYPNPLPDAFYSGNTVSEQFVGLRQNYYAWEWGSALFVVLDPYWYTKKKPDWGWTLGADQYNWFKNVLRTSKAQFKFVFAHQLVGGNGTDGRGGSEYVDFFEMGGRNQDSTWAFDANRPGWEKPIHALMLENNATVYFHGHDHFYGKQDKDGIVYQEVPQPSLKNYTNISAAQYGYVNGVLIPSRGYLLVTVSDTTTKVEYIRTYLPSEESTQRHNKDVSHSYTITKTGTTTNVVESTPVPDRFMLSQNYPNPFNPSTNIEYRIANAGFVTLKIFDILGREVATLVEQYRTPGTYTVSFDAQKLTLTSGIYFSRLTAGEMSETKKLVLAK
jgi:hypothetical protein